MHSIVLTASLKNVSIGIKYVRLKSWSIWSRKQITK